MDHLLFCNSETEKLLSELLAAIHRRTERNVSISETYTTREGTSFGRTRRVARDSNFWIAAWWNSIRACDPVSSSPRINALVSLNGAYIGARWISWRPTRHEQKTPHNPFEFIYMQTTKLPVSCPPCAATYGRGYACEALTHARICARLIYTYRIRTYVGTRYLPHGVYYSQV